MTIRKTTKHLLVAVLAATSAPAAFAASPYDTAYGLQWNYMTGGTGNDLPLDVAVTDDGNVWAFTAQGTDTWGNGTPNIGRRSGLGNISPNGLLNFGVDMPNLPGRVGTSQVTAAGVSTIGNTAYFGAYVGTSGSYWTGEDGTDAVRNQVWSLDSTGTGSLGNTHTLSKFTNAGVARTDTLQPNLPGGGLGLGSQTRTSDSDIMASTRRMVFAGDAINDGFANTGDWDATVGGFQPFVGIYDFNTNTLTGPATQASAPGGTSTNDAIFFHSEIDQVTGTYWGVGTTHGRTNSDPTAYDPDGTAGAAAAIALAKPGLGGGAGIANAYDSANNLKYSVVWESSAGRDIMSTVASTDDGSDDVFFGGEVEGNISTFTHPSAGTGVDKGYIAKYNSAGVKVWDDFIDISATGADGVAEITVEDDGSILVSGDTLGADGFANSYLRKYTKTGPNSYTEAFTVILDDPGAGDDFVVDHAGDGDDAVYLLSQADNTWANTTGHTFAGGSHDLLVQKLTAGDFNADGVVDYVDVDVLSAAVAGGPLIGVDTYDFNRDGDSTAADGVYFVTDILDRLYGDVEGTDIMAGVVSDVDVLDLILAAGNFTGSGTSGSVYTDGDIDFDGDVDVLDLIEMAGEFSGSAAGSLVDTAAPDLIYDSETGTVTIDSDGGPNVTGFQLNNDSAAFLFGDYTAPVGADVSEAGESVLSYFSFSGGFDIAILGNVLPTDLDLAGLETLLSAAGFSAGFGNSGEFDLIVVPEPSSLALLGLGGLFLARRRRG